MYLTDATNEQIKAHTQAQGYTFTDDDCEHLRAESFEGETLSEAVTDYLNAYER
jgi:hypothetical protein